MCLEWEAEVDNGAITGGVDGVRMAGRGRRKRVDRLGVECRGARTRGRLVCLWRWGTLREAMLLVYRGGMMGDGWHGAR